MRNYCKIIGNYRFISFSSHQWIQASGKWLWNIRLLLLEFFFEQIHSSKGNLWMMTRVLLLYAIQILGAAAFSANFISNSVEGKPVKFEVKGQLSKINGLILSSLATRWTSLVWQIWSKYLSQVHSTLTLCALRTVILTDKWKTTNKKILSESEAKPAPEYEYGPSYHSMVVGSQNAVPGNIVAYQLQGNQSETISHVLWEGFILASRWNIWTNKFESLAAAKLAKEKIEKIKKEKWKNLKSVRGPKGDSSPWVYGTGLPAWL